MHRDIQPPNVMYDPESDSVKVTDFGIARITDGSKTTTGGVLSGHVSFAGDAMAQLVFRIAW